MPLYVVSFLDNPGAQQKRLDARQAHLDYVRGSGIVKLGGPYLNAAGEMIGSMLVIEAQDEAAARAFCDSDPYKLAGVYSDAQVTPWRCTVGPLG